MNSVLVIDDDPISNFLNKITINEATPAGQTHTFLIE